MEYEEEYFAGNEGSTDYTEDKPYTWEHRKAYIQATLRDIKAMCVGPDTVLDVGCATGLLVRELERSGCNAYGIDISRWATSRAESNVLRADAARLPFADKAFDLVLCMDVLEHMHPSMLHRVVSEITRTARREVMIRVPCVPEDLVSTLTEEHLAMYTGDTTHKCIRAPWFWKNLFLRPGWRLLSMTNAVDLHLIPMSWYMVFRRIECRHDGRDNVKHAWYG